MQRQIVVTVTPFSFGMNVCSAWATLCSFASTSIGYERTTLFLIDLSIRSLAVFSLYSGMSHLNANGNMLNFCQMASISLFTSSSFVLFLVTKEKIFLILPSLTKPEPSGVVTNGSHAYA